MVFGRPLSADAHSRGAAASGASTPSPPGALTWGRVGSHPGAPAALPWVPLLHFKLWLWSCEFPSSLLFDPSLFWQDQTHGAPAHGGSGAA